MTESEYQREAQRLRPMLVNMGKQLLGDTEAAEDAAQEVLLKLWQRVNDLRIPLDGLARTAMHNHCISLLRSHTILLPLSDTLTVEDSPEPDKRIELMSVAIEELPEVQKTILRLRHVKGLEMKRIAEITGMNEAAVRKALSRARLSVKQKVINRR